MSYWTDLSLGGTVPDSGSIFSSLAVLSDDSVDSTILNEYGVDSLLIIYTVSFT